MTIESTVAASSTVEAFVHKKQKEILQRKGLWSGRRRVTECAVREDRLELGASTIRATEATGGPRGSFTVEALRGCSPVASFEWSYSVRGDNEVWRVRASRRERGGRVLAGKLTYDGRGSSKDRLSSDPGLVEVFFWLFRDERVATPDWVGGLSFTGAKTQYALITIDDCVPCDTPFCSC